MVRGALIAAVAAALLVALPAPVASASDQSVYDAWVSRDDDFARLGARTGRQLRAWKDRDYRRPAKLLRTLRRT